MSGFERRPVRSKRWPTYDKGDVFVDGEDVRAASDALERRLYFRYDYRPLAETEVGRLESKLQGYFAARHALAVSSGTTAIALGLMASGVKPGSLVACPGFTFAATPSAILLAGCKPLLVECDEDLHFDLDDLRRKLSPEVGAIVVVHMRGFASDVRAIAEIARQAGIPMIEDAVPALGLDLYGKKVGTFGTMGAFSTQSDKSLNTGEGGFVLCDDPTVFAKAVILSGAYEGRYKRHFVGPAPEVRELEYPIFSFRMDEIRGALASAEMDRLPRRLQRLRTNYEHVVDRLSHIDGIRIRRPVAPGAMLGDSLMLRMPDAPVTAVVEVARALKREGIDARALGAPDDVNVRCFWNWRFLFGGMDTDAIKATLPRTARFLSEVIDIPMSPTLGARDCDDLVRAIETVLAPPSRRPSSTHRVAARTAGAMLGDED